MLSVRQTRLALTESARILVLACVVLMLTAESGIISQYVFVIEASMEIHFLNVLDLQVSTYH